MKGGPGELQCLIGCDTGCQDQLYLQMTERYAGPSSSEGRVVLKQAHDVVLEWGQDHDFEAAATLPFCRHTT